MTGRERLAAAFVATHPDTAARLFETLPPDAVGRFVATVDARAGARLLEQMLPGHAARAVDDVAPDRVAEVLRHMDSQAAVALLRQRHDSARAALLAALPRQWAAAFELLLRYPASAVGAWAEPLVLTLPDDCTVGEARERVERDEQTVKARIYVLDRTRRIRGAVRGLALLRSAAGVRLAAIVEPAAALWARETVTAALESELWERNAEAPVVTRERQFVGAVAYADLRRAQRTLSRAAAGGEQPKGWSEVAELIATGAGGIWDSVGELVRPPTRSR